MLGILKLMQPQLEVVATTVRVDTTMQYMCYQGDHGTFHSFSTTRLNVALGFLLLFALTLDLKT